jgi:hypothetical protein
MYTYHNRKIPAGGCIREQSVTTLAGLEFDVLMTHESPRDAVLAGSGSEGIGLLIEMTQPVFAFFGHYGGWGGRIEGEFGRTQFFHLCGFEMRREGSCAEKRSVGVLTWDGKAGSFECLDDAWLRHRLHRASPEPGGRSRRNEIGRRLRRLDGGRCDGGLAVVAWCIGMVWDRLDHSFVRNTAFRLEHPHE